MTADGVEKGHGRTDWTSKWVVINRRHTGMVGIIGIV